MVLVLHPLRISVKPIFLTARMGFAGTIRPCTIRPDDVRPKSPHPMGMGKYPMHSDPVPHRPFFQKRIGPM